MEYTTWRRETMEYTTWRYSHTSWKQGFCFQDSKFNILNFNFL